MSDDILTLPPPQADAEPRYGAHRAQFGELRLPAGAGPHPVVVVIHGGFWRALYTLRHIGHLAAALTAAGVATWSLEYRRVGLVGDGWPQTLLDVARGADYLRVLADVYPLDLSRVVTLGHSAGGQLALWLAARHALARAHPDSPLATPNPLPLAGAVALAGVVDLRRAAELRLGGGAVERLLGGSPERVPDRYAAASPFDLLPLGAGVRQTLIHGADDEIVPLELSRRYDERARALGDLTELLPVPGAGHFELIDPRSTAWPPVRRATLELCVASDS